VQADPSRVARGVDQIALSILICVILLGTLAATLTPAPEWQRAKGRLWCVLCDEGSAADAIGNTLLFVPFGFVLGLRGVGGGRTVPSAAALSVIVELSQFAIPGRDPNVGDVIFNTAGATLGWMTARTAPGLAFGRQIVRALALVVVPPAALRAWLTLGSAATVSGLMVVTCLLLIRDYPEGSYLADRGALDSTSGPLHLGGNPDDRDFFLGVVDEVKVFSRARTAEEIRGGMGTPLRLSSADRRATHGLVAAYDFDHDARGAVVDMSGHGHDGVASYAVHVDGKFGKGLKFIGRSGDVVSIPSARDLNFTSDLTIEAWVFPTRPQRGWGNVLHKDGDAYFLSAGSDAGSLRAAAGGSFAGQIESLYDAALLPLHVWSHLAMTYDGGTLVFYVNGEPTAMLHRWSSARLLEASVGSSRIDATGTENEAALRSNLLNGRPIRLRLERSAPGPLAPVVRIRDGRNRSILVIATESTDLVLRPRVLAARLGLKSPEFRIHSVLGPPQSGEVTVNISLDVNRHCVGVDGRSWCGVGPSVASGWAFFVDSAAAPWWLERLYAAVWMTLLFIVPGFYACRFGPALVAVVSLGLSVFAVPELMRLSPVTPPLLIVAVTAFAGGWGVRVLIHRKIGYV
jgi:hypothetical protein